MTDTCECATHLDCHVDCACPKPECEYILLPAEEARYDMENLTNLRKVCALCNKEITTPHLIEECMKANDPTR